MARRRTFMEKYGTPGQAAGDDAPPETLNP